MLLWSKIHVYVHVNLLDASKKEWRRVNSLNYRDCRKGKQAQILVYMKSTKVLKLGAI